MTTSSIVRLDLRLSRAVEDFKGIRLESGDLELLASLGLFNLTHRAKAEYLQEQTRCRAARRRSIDGGNTSSLGPPLQSPNLTIWLYDPAAGRIRSATTGTAQEDLGILALARRYLADADEAPAFCNACGQPLAQAQAYLLTDAIADYRLEWGDARASGDTIQARLNHVLDFLDVEQAKGAAGRFGITSSCAAACSTVFANALRTWSREQPVTWKNSKGEVTKSRPRSRKLSRC